MRSRTEKVLFQHIFSSLLARNVGGLHHRYERVVKTGTIEKSLLISSAPQLPLCDDCQGPKGFLQIESNPELPGLDSTRRGTIAGGQTGSGGPPDRSRDGWELQ